MRIGLLTYGLDRPLTGIGRYTLELAKAMSALRPQPDVVLLCAGGRGPLAQYNGSPYTKVAGARLLPGLMTAGNLVLSQLAQRLKLDVIHDPTGTTPLLFAMKQCAAIVTIHDVFAWSLPGHSSLLDTLIYKQWLPRILPKVDAVITVSRQSQDDIQKYLSPPAERVRVIPYGVTNLFRPISPPAVQKHLQERFGFSFPYLLYVGALTQRKNIERALEAFARIRHHFPDLHFVLAGPRTWKQTPVEDILQKLQIGDKVHLTGPLTDKDLPALYNGAALFVFPSLYEGFGLPVLEAMACGTPVLTSNVSSLPEVAGDAAVLVDPTDVEAIAAAMRRVLQDQALAAALSAKGLARAQQFTWERTARETIKVYEKVLVKNVPHGTNRETTK